MEEGKLLGPLTKKGLSIQDSWQILWDRKRYIKVYPLWISFKQLHGNGTSWEEIKEVTCTCTLNYQVLINQWPDSHGFSIQFKTPDFLSD